MRVSIIGAGAMALAAASYLKLKDVSSLVYVRSEKKLAAWSTKPVRVTGVMESSFYVPMAETMKEAVNYSDTVIICTRAGDYEDVINELLPCLRKGQCILFLNGCWGAVKTYRLLKEDAKYLTIAETAGSPFVASLSEDFLTLEMKGIRTEIRYSALGTSKDPGELLHTIAPRVSRISSPVFTSLSQAMPIVNAASAFFNISRIENGEDFELFGPSFTSRAADYMEHCDKERLAVGKALGLELYSLLETVNSQRSEKKATLYEALKNNALYDGLKGPVSLSDRSLSEDLPCGLGSLLDLADMMHVPAPYITAMVDTASLYMGKPYEPFLTVQDLRAIKALRGK